VTDEEIAEYREWTFAGTFTGTMTMADATEIPPTGKTLELPCVTIGEVNDGRFLSMHDNLEVMTVDEPTRADVGHLSHLSGPSAMSAPHSSIDR
jgi:hypothetical protein